MFGDTLRSKQPNRDLSSIWYFKGGVWMKIGKGSKLKAHIKRENMYMYYIFKLATEQILNIIFGL